ncbi:MAG: CRISPR-associated endoribonuclease Cse3 [Meiothermus sp.]|uniref:type I-E CRISPR-associated protein Cas6/Cse3/CasE n=1 Tax=Meiothermus sp. TaxID=1955249 RepID=UPI0021DBC846|nr:type I-E CRISPR-associated protein Cas6/Cse3/CasE [Meiothermus sp.]GIW29391.1 MAG: CRISPR-associated endoribonuclease Cse3 [Meiothermus sp.]
MYLSKLVLNLKNARARADLENPYEMHSTLCWLFENPKKERFLWRLEEGTRHDPPYVLLQSRTEPAWTRMLGREGWEDYLIEKDHKSYTLISRLNSGRVYRFRLRANPTVTKFDEKSGKSKRRGIAKENEQIAWLERQGVKGGFELLHHDADDGVRIPSVHVLDSRVWKVSKRQTQSHMILRVVLYQGHLRITNTTEFIRLLESGVGHSKALGLGLLSIARG